MSETEIDFTTIDSLEIDDHLVLLKKNTTRIQILNPLASLIWQFKESGLSHLNIANEISEAFEIPIELALQDATSINAQWQLDLSTSSENKILEKSLVSLPKELSHWQGKFHILLSFSGFTIRVNLDSEVIFNKVKRLFSALVVSNASQINAEFDVVSGVDDYFVVRNDLVLEQIKAESYAPLMVFHHVVDFACKYHDWLVILHAGGVSWKGAGIVFPALGGSGKTTLTAALIKQGFGYINDDVIPLIRGTEELVHLPTSLSVKQGSWSILKSLYPELDKLDVYGKKGAKVKYLPSPSHVSPSRLKAKHIVLPNYQAGATAKLEPLSSVLALQAIIEGESLLRLPLDKADIAGLIKWLLPLTCHRLTYDKLDTAVDLLRQFCESNDDA